MATRKNRRQKKRKGGMRKSLKVGGSKITDFNEYMQAKICVYVCFENTQYTYSNKPIIKIKNIVEQTNTTDLIPTANNCSGFTNIKYELSKNFAEFSKKFSSLKTLFLNKNIKSVPYVILHGVFKKKGNTTPESLLKKIATKTITSITTTIDDYNTTDFFNFGNDDPTKKSDSKDALIDFDVEYKDENSTRSIVWVWWESGTYKTNGPSTTTTPTADGFWAMKEVTTHATATYYYNFNGSEIQNASGVKVIEI